MKKIIATMLRLVITFSLVSCGTGNNNETTSESTEKSSEISVLEEQSTEAGMTEEAYYPVTISTGDSEIIIEKMPENVLVFNYDIAEIMSALGLADKITYFRGGHQSLEDILPEYRDDLKGLKDTDEIAAEHGFPSLEVILNLEPEIILMPSYYFNVDIVGEKEDYYSNGIDLYIMEGTYIPNCTIENTYNDVINIGKIFNVETRANELVESMKERVATVEKNMEGIEPANILAIDSEVNGEIVTWGGSGLGNNLMTVAGANNVFGSIDKQFPHVSWEELIASDPDFIIITVYGDDESKGQDKINMLKEKPETADLKAVKEDKFIIIPVFSSFPSLQNIDTIEKISEAILNSQE